MSYFDEKAATWDQNRETINRSKAISAAIMHAVPLSTTWQALEYGCGTGALSFLLHPYLQSIVLMDDSSEMLKVLGQKIADHGIATMRPIKLNLMNDRYEGRHDIIYTQMALHHIVDTERIIRIFYGLLKRPGYVCIADLFEEDGTFHDHHVNYDGLNGFNPDALQDVLASAGFTDISTLPCHEMEKKAATGEMRKYPLFLMVGKKD